MNGRTSTLDWLSYTIPWNNPRIKRLSPRTHAELICERTSGLIERWHAERALHGYMLQYVSVEKKGLRVMLSNHGNEMGVHVQFAGSALTNQDVEERLDYALREGGQITRLDIAVDVLEKWDIEAMYEDVKAGGVQTRSKRHSLITSDSGTTLYIGSRTSEKFLRIYDKGAQTGGGREWTRIELECKGRFAQNVSRYIQGAGVLKIPHVIRGFADFPHLEHWAEAMESDADAVGLPVMERSSNTRLWLIEQVAPALAKFAQGDEAVLYDFYTRVKSLLPSQQDWNSPESGVGRVD